MVKYTGVTTRQVSRVWAVADLKLHRLQTVRLSQDPQSAEKAIDIVEW